jgi:hypothetical protein
MAAEKMTPQNHARNVAVGRDVSSVGGTAPRTSSIGESSRLNSELFSISEDRSNPSSWSEDGGEEGFSSKVLFSMEILERTEKSQGR